jgi:hypothetical protein
LIQWVRILVRITWSPVSETIAFVCSIGMWQSMQLRLIEAPIVFSIPQLSTRWHVKHLSEYAAAGRSAACTSWHVEQLISGDDK